MGTIQGWSAKAVVQTSWCDLYKHMDWIALLVEKTKKVKDGYSTPCLRPGFTCTCKTLQGLLRGIHPIESACRGSPGGGPSPEYPPERADPSRADRLPKGLGSRWARLHRFR